MGMYSRIWILAIALACLVSVLQAGSVRVVADADAAKFVGRNVEVRGQVASVYIGKHGDAYVFFGAGYPKQTFTGYIPAGWTFSGGAWTFKLQGQIISITGTVEMYQGKPEIKILSMDQIKRVDLESKPK
jgi:hypothetical protein